MTCCCHLDKVYIYISGYIINRLIFTYLFTPFIPIKLRITKSPIFFKNTLVQNLIIKFFTTIFAFLYYRYIDIKI